MCWLKFTYYVTCKKAGDEKEDRCLLYLRTNQYYHWSTREFLLRTGHGTYQADLIQCFWCRCSKLVVLIEREVLMVIVDYVGEKNMAGMAS